MKNIEPRDMRTLAKEFTGQEPGNVAMANLVHHNREVDAEEDSLARRMGEKLPQRGG